MGATKCEEIENSLLASGNSISITHLGLAAFEVPGDSLVFNSSDLHRTLVHHH